MRAELLPFAVLVAAVACGSAAPPSPATIEVRHFGALRQIMHEGRTKAAVRLDQVVPGPHAFALGALSELRGEVTVVDDVVWTAYPRDDGTAEVRTGAMLPP